jgi:hypothetical protein
MQDTVEKDVADLAEEIVQEDKARQAQELVCWDTLYHKTL